MVANGASAEQANRQVWLVDKQGLLTDEMSDLRNYQRPYARPSGEVKEWAGGSPIDLLTTVRHVKPTILLGTSTMAGGFTEDIIKAMAAGVDRPIVFPLSNPTERIEAMPADVLAWTNGKALCAVGIPVPPVELDGTRFTIGQANNALLYPGLGLGTIISRAKHVTDGMLLAAADAVASQVASTALGHRCSHRSRTSGPARRSWRARWYGRPLPTELPTPISVTSATTASWSNSSQMPCGSRSTPHEPPNATSFVTSHRAGAARRSLTFPSAFDATGRRSETDSMGAIEVRRPLGGADPALPIHFSIGDDRMPKAVLAYGYVQGRAGQTGLTGACPRKAKLIAGVADAGVAAIDDLLTSGRPWSGPVKDEPGVNEVISNRAIRSTDRRHAGQQGSGAPQRRRRHRSVIERTPFPTAMHIAAVAEISDHLLPAVRDLHDADRVQGARVGAVRQDRPRPPRRRVPPSVRSGPATPPNADAMTKSMPRWPALYQLAAGGDGRRDRAQRSGGLRPAIATEIAQLTRNPFESAPDKFRAQGGLDAMVAASAGVRALAVPLMEFADDIRWLA